MSSIGIISSTGNRARQHAPTKTCITESTISGIIVPLRGNPRNVPDALDEIRNTLYSLGELLECVSAGSAVLGTPADNAPDGSGALRACIDYVAAYVDTVLRVEGERL